MDCVKKLLPARIVAALDLLDPSNICEIRLRTSGVAVNYGGSFYALSERGLGSVGIKLNVSEIEEFIYKASGRSVYAVNDQIKNGFLALNGGIRIGICGEVVDGKTIKNFSSVNIRFPHEVKGCANKVVSYIVRGQRCYNTLIVSPPGCGKTTLLRDLVRQLSNRGINVLLADERGEIEGGGLDVGNNTDVLSGASKRFAFDRGIRYMRPDLLAADEIVSSDDMEAVRVACYGGVSVIATLHGNGMAGISRFGNIDFMERIVLMSDVGGPGRIEGIYDVGGNKIS